jgi:hypothetical protein
MNSRGHQFDAGIGVSIVRVSSDCGAGSSVPGVVRLLWLDSQGCERRDKKKDNPHHRADNVRSEACHFVTTLFIYSRTTSDKGSIGATELIFDFY